MIIVHNVRGEPFALNAALIERAEGGAETHVTLVAGNRYVVREDLQEVVDLVRRDRAEVEAMARDLMARPDDELDPVLRLIANHEDGREP